MSLWAPLRVDAPKGQTVEEKVSWMRDLGVCSAAACRDIGWVDRYDVDLPVEVLRVLSAEQFDYPRDQDPGGKEWTHLQ